MTCARLDHFSGTGDQSMEFSDPEREVAAYRMNEVIGVLEQAELAARDGLWPVGYVTYDAIPAFNQSLVVRDRDQNGPQADLPLAWFGLFRERRDVSPFVGESRLDTSPYTASPWIPTMGEHEYAESVERIRRLINAGELTQVNYALTLDAAISGDLLEFYRDLVLSQRGGNGAYLDLGRFRILSASPERFFAVKGSSVTVRPIKGTITRGRWSSEDEFYANRLVKSAKVRAEHEEIVDCMLKELASVGNGDPATISEFMGLERLETLWHMHSEMSATLDPDASIVDVFRALFPPAAVTGNPKRRALETIATLEGRSRGIYGGAIGFITPSDGQRPDASFSVAIRTVIVNAEEGVGEYGVGAGITADSIPVGEYEEAQAKTRVLIHRRPEISLYETVRWDENRGFRWLDRHLDRLRDSAAYFGFVYDSEVIRGAINRRVEGMSGAYGIRIELDRAGTVNVTSDLTELAPAQWRPHSGPGEVTCSISERPVSSESVYRFHKTTPRPIYSDRREMHEGVDDVLLVNERGELTGATQRNVAVLIGGTWVTPPLASGCLPGILREFLIDEGALVEEVVMAPDLDGADGIALMSALHGWQPARLVRR